MVPSSALCRMQEDFHRRRAASTTLENVRLLSISAAAAWAREALVAESREERQVHTRRVANAGIATEPVHAAGDDLSLSENPDRGFTHP